MTSLAARLIRPELVDLLPYNNGWSESQLESGIRLNANEAPTPLGGGLGESINRYPAAQPSLLIERFAEVYGVSPQNILATRGSDEVIDLLVRAFCQPGLDKVATVPPTFGAYSFAARLQGAPVIETPLDGDYELDIERLIENVCSDGNVKIVFLCTPMNPTGGSLDASAIFAVCDALPETLITVDEAYIEFSENESVAPAVSARENLVVLRTLSKAYGLAGARCGAAIAPSGVIEVLKKVIAPYPLPSPTIAAALRALTPQYGVLVERNIENTVAERRRVTLMLRQSPFVERILESDANFVFLETRNTSALKAELSRLAIRVRWFDQIKSGAIRLTIGGPEENDLVLRAFNIASESSANRSSEVFRETRETRIAASVDLDRTSPVQVSTGLGFFDHMLEQVSRHGGFSLRLSCQGDLKVDAHHTIEDCMLVLGEAIARALGDRRGVRRFGAALPMDETRAEVLIDLSGRPFSKFSGEFSASLIGDYPTEMTPHAFRSLSETLRAAIHVTVEGENDHHKTEACFKALGRALRQAVSLESDDIPSTKGVLA